MIVRNNTCEEIVIVYDSNELCCKPRESVDIKTNQESILIKSAKDKALSSCFKLFKHTGKENIKGNIIYFNPGFFTEYITRVSLSPDIREINIINFDLAIHSLLICRIFTTKEKLDKNILFEKDAVRKLMLFFVSLFAMPCCGASGLFAVICGCGIFFDFDWTLVVATLFLFLLLWAFVSISRSLYRCAKPDKHYGKILNDGKQIAIMDNRKHFISYIETDYDNE